MKVPLVDLGAQFSSIEEEIFEALQRVFDTTSFILGSEVDAFEEEFARFSGVEHCVGVANGTDALELALRAIGIGSGDEVLVPANSFIASALAVVRAGAKPVFVDCEPEFQLIDPDEVRRKLTSKVKAIMPVHLFGQMAPMEALEKITADAGIPIVEDAAQAQGCTRNGRFAGGIGVAAGTSFYPGKNLGAYGDAGAILTNSEETAARVRRLRNYGSEEKYHHPETGFNSRLDTLQAAVLRVKLSRLADWNEARRQAADRYASLLEGSAIDPPQTMDGNVHIWHLYVVRVPNRQHIIDGLQAKGIGAGVHYPVPIHLQGAFQSLGHVKGDFPNAEKAAEEILSLPLFPEITEEQQAYVVESLEEAVRR